MLRLFFIQHNRMKLPQFLSGKFDHATIIRHQSVDFGFHVGRLRVNAGGDPFGFQVGECPVE